MTASDLHRLFANTSHEQESYEGGREHWTVDSKYGDVFLTVSETTARVSVTTVCQLSDEDLDDMELALARAREARDNYRANDLRRAR